MRAIERTSQFKRDYQREVEGRPAATLTAALTAALDALVADAPLAEGYRDRPLAGDWSGFRNCHLPTDLLLIYEKPDATTLRLVRLGARRELGL